MQRIQGCKKKKKKEDVPIQFSELYWYGTLYVLPKHNPNYDKNIKTV